MTEGRTESERKTETSTSAPWYTRPDPAGIKSRRMVVEPELRAAPGGQVRPHGRAQRLRLAGRTDERVSDDGDGILRRRDRRAGLSIPSRSPGTAPRHQRLSTT